MTRYLQVITTLPGEREARELAASLVQDRLAACIQIDAPITSVYRWEGKVATASEWRLSIKLPAGNYAELEAAIRSRHPYEIPEIIAIPIEAGLQEYLAWVDEACRSDEQSS